MCRLVIENKRPKCWEFQKKTYSLNFGINHFHWHRVWDKEGQERTQELIDLIYGPKQEQESHLKNIFDAPFHYEQLKDLECYHVVIIAIIILKMRC